MIPVVLAGLIARAAAVAAISKVVKVVAALTKTHRPPAEADAPTRTAPPEPVIPVDSVVRIATSALKTPPGGWPIQSQIRRETPWLSRWFAPAEPRGPPLQIVRSSFKASLHPRSYPINASDPSGLEPLYMVGWDEPEHDLTDRGVVMRWRVNVRKTPPYSRLERMGFVSGPGVTIRVTVQSTFDHEQKYWDDWGQTDYPTGRVTKDKEVSEFVKLRPDQLWDENEEDGKRFYSIRVKFQALDEKGKLMMTNVDGKLVPREEQWIIHPSSLKRAFFEDKRGQLRLIKYPKDLHE